MNKDLEQFKCVGCGNCCRQEGYVRLSRDEPDKIAAFLKMDVYSFIETYTCITWDRHSLSLIDKENGECIFLSHQGCRINKVKPGQCLDFPIKWKFKAFDTICSWAKNR